MKKVDIAKQLGKKAYQGGMDRLSRLDAELQGMLSLIHRTNVSLLKAWYAGYDEALAEANGAPTAMELQERVAKAEAAGKAAFAAGLVSTPALDPNLSPLISSCQPGQGVKVIEAWTRGWHSANVEVRP